MTFYYSLTLFYNGVVGSFLLLFLIIWYCLWSIAMVFGSLWLFDIICDWLLLFDIVDWNLRHQERSKEIL